ADDPPLRAAQQVEQAVHTGTHEARLLGGTAQQTSERRLAYEERERHQPGMKVGAAPDDESRRSNAPAQRAGGVAPAMAERHVVIAPRPAVGGHGQEQSGARAHDAPELLERGGV